MAEKALTAVREAYTEEAAGSGVNAQNPAKRAEIISRFQ
jgi:hypothetical protein